MAVKYPVDGFNPKEQKIFDLLYEGDPLTIKEMKKVFMIVARKRAPSIYHAGWGTKEVSDIAQSYVRNALRRLVDDGWVEKCARGTYILSNKGLKWVEKGVHETKSFRGGKWRRDGSKKIHKQRAKKGKKKIKLRGPKRKNPKKIEKKINKALAGFENEASVALDSIENKTLSKDQS